LLAQTEPGAEGLVLQPFWNPVLGETGPEGRGSIIGFKDFHTRAHVYRALIEGLAFALRSGKERIERRTKTPISCIRLSGGGAQSDQVAQIVADVLNLPVERFDDCEASGRGAAMVGAAAVGWYSSIAAAGEAMAGETHRTTPNPDVTERYQALYKGQYRASLWQAEVIVRAATHPAVVLRRRAASKDDECVTFFGRHAPWADIAYYASR
jgi:sugar (pentulose or hexulose) kinase